MKPIKNYNDENLYNKNKGSKPESYKSYNYNNHKNINYQNDQNEIQFDRNNKYIISVDNDDLSNFRHDIDRSTDRINNRKIIPLNDEPCKYTTYVDESEVIRFLSLDR